jgi:hypothetical protein
MILLKTIVGERTKAIAEELNISVHTVNKELNEARRGNLIVVARDQVARLIPKAIATLEAHLDMGDKDIALLVLEGLGVIGKHMQVTVAPPSGGREDTFYEFRARVLQTKQAGSETVAATQPRPAAQIAGPIVDAEIETGRGQEAGSQGAEGGAL